MPFRNVRSYPREKGRQRLVNTDVKGPMETIGLDGSRYYVSLFCDCTDLTVVYVIKSRDEVFECFKEYEALACNHFQGKRIGRDPGVTTNKPQRRRVLHEDIQRAAVLR